MLVWCQSWPGMLVLACQDWTWHWSTLAVHVETATPGCCLVRATSSHFRHLTEHLVRSSFLQGHWGQKCVFIWVLTRGPVVPLSTDCGKSPSVIRFSTWPEVKWDESRLRCLPSGWWVLSFSRAGQDILTIRLSESHMASPQRHHSLTAKEGTCSWQFEEVQVHLSLQAFETQYKIYSVGLLLKYRFTKALVQWFLGQTSSLDSVLHAAGNFAWSFWIPVRAKCILVTLWWGLSCREVVKISRVIWPLLSATNDELWLCTKKQEMQIFLLFGEVVTPFVKTSFKARAPFTGQELNSYFSFFFV